MTVFTWVHYGETSVYAADTSEQLDKLLKEIISLLDMMREKDLLQKVTDVAYSALSGDEESKCDVLKRAINIAVVPLIGDCDEFDYGTGFATVLNA